MYTRIYVVDDCGRLEVIDPESQNRQGDEIHDPSDDCKRSAFDLGGGPHRLRDFGGTDRKHYCIPDVPGQTASGGLRVCWLSGDVIAVRVGHLELHIHVECLSAADWDRSTKGARR